ncbi:MAG: hypothetical protein RXR43_11645 [Sulfolobus sp.]
MEKYLNMGFENKQLEEKKMAYIENWDSNDGDRHYFCSDCHVELALIRGDGKIIYLGNCKHFKWRKISYKEFKEDESIVLPIFRKNKVYVLKKK